MAVTRSSLVTCTTYLQAIWQLLLLLAMLARVNARGQSRDVQTLLSFKAANAATYLTYTESDSGIDLTKVASSVGYFSAWKEMDENVCAWVGVTCTCNFTVEKLDLSGWGLKRWNSTNVEILSKLTDLRKLDLSSNNLGMINDAGNIVGDILTLAGLTDLDLSRNNFTGSIPTNISSSRSLRYLSFQRNCLRGPIPSDLRGFVNLQILVLADNMLDGPIPPELGELSSLITIDLSDNYLSGSFPSLSNWTNLVALRLDNNFFTDRIGEFPSSNLNLRHFSVSRNQLVNAIPHSIGNLINLEALDMSYNNLSGEIPHNLSTSLQYLFLESNQLTGPIPVDGLINLNALVVARNYLSGTFRAAGISSLVVLKLSGNLLTGGIPNLTNFTDIQYLNLESNGFTSTLKDQLPLNQSLVYLSLAKNHLFGQIPPALTNQANLAVLDLSQNALSGRIPYGFSQLMNNSFSLDLSGNSLTGSIPPDFFQPSPNDIRLSSINLSNNDLTGYIQLDGAKQYAYDVFDLSGNRLTGPIPNFGNKSRILSALALQNNLLSGDIGNFWGDSANNWSIHPTSELRLGSNFLSGDLSRMARPNLYSKSTKIVDLSNNNFQMIPTKEVPDPLKALLDTFNGQDPEEGSGLKEFRLGGNNFSEIQLLQDQIGYYSSLEVLDLGNSHLKGEIQNATITSTSFPALKILNLSNNDLTGPVPQSIVLLPHLAALDLNNNNLSGPLPFIQPSTTLYNSSFYEGNVGLCGGPLRPCLPDPSKRTGLQWWVLMIIVGGSYTLAVGSCFVTTWRWRMYHRRHQQDADLIKMLMERESASLMSLQELKKATNNFARSAQIGEGGFGTVYIGKLNDGTLVAIKKSKRGGFEKDKGQFLNEVRILSQVNHRHLVKLLGCCMANKIALLVFEFVSNGTLQEHLQQNIGEKFLSWKQRLKIAMQTADALNYLHSAASYPIYHRDVKSSNILLNDDLDAKVADFGISKLAPIEATHVSTVAIQGTIGYLDPEYYTSYKLSDRSDVYSFGVVLLELISAKLVIDLQRGGDGTSLVNFAKPYIQSEDLQQFLDPTLMETYTNASGRASMLSLGRLAMKCLDMRSKARPSMNEVCKELQDLWLELICAAGTSLASIDQVDKDDAQFDHHVLRSQSLPNKRFGFISYNDSSDIEMQET